MAGPRFKNHKIVRILPRLKNHKEVSSLTEAVPQTPLLFVNSVLTLFLKIFKTSSLPNHTSYKSEFWENVHFQLCVTCQVSCVKKVSCQVSGVRCHMSHINSNSQLKSWNFQRRFTSSHRSCVMFHMSHVICNMSNVTNWLS